MINKTYYSAKEVSNLLNVDRTTVTRWAAAGLFPGSFKAGPFLRSGYRIPVAVIDAMVAANSSTPTPQSTPMAMRNGE